MGFHILYICQAIKKLTMEKVLKILVIILIALLGINLIKGFFGENNNLNDAIDKINQSQQKLDSSLMQINYARTRIDSIRNDMEVFKQYVKDIQGRVEILDLENRKSLADYRKHRDSLQNRLKDLYTNVDTTADNLPDIKDRDL